MITTVSCNIFICLHVLLIYHARSLEAGLTELGRAVVLHAWLFQMILRCLCEFFRLQVILHLVFGMVLPWDSQFCEHEKDLFIGFSWSWFTICNEGKALLALEVVTCGKSEIHRFPCIFMVPTWWHADANLNAGYGHNSGRVYQSFSGLSGLAILNISSESAFVLVFFFMLLNLDWNKNVKQIACAVWHFWRFSVKVRGFRARAYRKSTQQVLPPAPPGMWAGRNR